MNLSLGDIYIGWARDMRMWWRGLVSYKAVRFLGFGNGRFFIGCFWGTKKGDYGYMIERRDRIHKIKDISQNDSTAVQNAPEAPKGGADE